MGVTGLPPRLLVRNAPGQRATFACGTASATGRLRTRVAG